MYNSLSLMKMKITKTKTTIDQDNALEDRYGLTIEKGENGVSMRVDSRKGKDAAELSEMINAWTDQAEKYRKGDFSREDYDKWRYNYPKYDKNSCYIKAPSQELNYEMLEAFNDRLKDM